jgi:hypothetical protein
LVVHAKKCGAKGKDGGRLGNIAFANEIFPTSAWAPKMERIVKRLWYCLAVMGPGVDVMMLFG